MSKRVGATFALLVVSFLLVACESALPSPGSGPMEQSPLLGALERKSGLIAYMGLDGNIYTINQGGGKLQAITNDAYLPEDDSDTRAKTYLFPTWSPDSDQLAFMSVSAEDGAQQWRILTADVPAKSDNPAATEIYSSETAPIYLYWSPDNENVSFLTSAPSGGLLLEMAPAHGGETAVLDAGQPLYWDWSPDGNRLLIHTGGGAENGRLAFLTPQERVIEEGLAIRPSFFQSPHWSPDGRQLLLAARSEDNDSNLILADSQGDPQDTLLTGDAPLAFAWSPDGQKIATIASEVALTQGVLGPLTVLNLENPDDSFTTAEGEQVIAFFWSPDSQKIAYFVPQRAAAGENETDARQPTLILGLHLLDVDKGESEALIAFQPTPQFLSILPFFDQYHRSATIWSPDSKNLVLTAVINAQTPQLWVVATSGNLEPRSIGEGWLAFWSWE